MDPAVRSFIKGIIEKTIALKGAPKRVLEIGPSRKPDKSLLTLDCLQGSVREGISIGGAFALSGIKVYIGNSNNMEMFEDGRFDMVISNAVLEHDRYFWKSVEEYKRVLAIGGTLIVGVPGFVESETAKISSPVFKYHMKEDYYRFSPLAVSKVFLRGLDSVEVQIISKPPRIIGVGTKL
jgi:SAM-dependent methyltransferase